MGSAIAVFLSAWLQTMLDISAVATSSLIPTSSSGTQALRARARPICLSDISSDICIHFSDNGDRRCSLGKPSSLRELLKGLRLVEQQVVKPQSAPSCGNRPEHPAIRLRSPDGVRATAGCLAGALQELRAREVGRPDILNPNFRTSEGGPQYRVRHASARSR